MSGDVPVQTRKNQLSQDVQWLRSALGVLPEPVVKPAFVVVSGLPGTGKSYFCRELAEKTPFCIVESDALRKVLFSSPSYSQEESTRLFDACHALIGQLLQDGISVILDATNLSEYHREHLYAISSRTKAKLVLVRVEAPSELVYERLEVRDRGIHPEDKSDADREIYRRMQSRVDRIRRNHLVVDTSRDIALVIDKVIRLINR
ncbi:MAG: ATP-binding protein [Chloroflexi bacterium]|nr:ATP-binding protein [Chloroflexota bacterium]